MASEQPTLFGMSQSASARTVSQEPAPKRCFRPRSFNRRTQTPFISRRRAFWLARVTAEPIPRQQTLAETIAALEWAAETARHENTLTSLRDLREHLRLRDRAVADFERSLQQTPPRKLTPDEVLAAIHSRSTAA